MPLNRKYFKSQSGFTVVEMLVASIMLVVGLLATLGMLNSANHSNEITERHQVAVGIAQRALEETADLNFDQLSLTSTPLKSSDPDSPLNRVNASVFRTELESDETMVISGASAAVNPGAETVNEGGVNAQVYRFVTWVDVPTYEGCSQDCSSTQDYKRITVAVQATSPNNKGFAKYVLVSTLRIDPLLGPEGQVTQPPDPNPTESHDNFYLYDTPNDNCLSTAYQQPSSDHVTHDTLEDCSSTDGKYPDLMATTLPPNPSDPDLPPLYTYSTDLIGSYTGGLAIERNTPCTQVGLNKFQTHSWTTNPLSTDYQLSGMLSFDFWSATVGGTPGNGKICVWLYHRDIVDGAPVDVPIANGSHELSSWPGSLTNMSFTVSHDSYTVPAGHQLHFVLTVSSTSATDLHFAYDNPAYTSFIQIRTTTPITQ